MNENRTYNPGDIPEYVLKTSSVRCCSSLAACGAVRKDESIELCPDLSGLIPLAGVVTRDKSRAMSGAHALGSVLVKTCEAAARCSEWLVPDRYLDLSLSGLFYDPASESVVIMPGKSGGELSFAQKICDLARELQKELPWLESEHLVRKLCESGAGDCSDIKTVTRQISQILLK